MIEIQIHVDQKTAARARRVGALFTSGKVRLAIAAAVLAVPLVAVAGPLTVPNAFTAGEVISASQMNANFDAVKTAVDDNDARITTLEASAVLDACTWEYAVDTSANSVTATCPTNTHAITGGCANNGGAAVTQNRPSGVNDGDPAATASQWHCAFDAVAGVTVYALCCAF